MISTKVCGMCGLSLVSRLPASIAPESFPSLPLSPLRCLQYLRAMPHADVSLGSESVWALTTSQALHPSAEAAIDACERATRVSGTSHWALGRLEKQALEARWDAQMELEAGGLTVRAPHVLLLPTRGSLN